MLQKERIQEGVRKEGSSQGDSFSCSRSLHTVGRYGQRKILETIATSVLPLVAQWGRKTYFYVLIFVMGFFCCNEKLVGRYMKHCQTIEFAKNQIFIEKHSQLVSLLKDTSNHYSPWESDIGFFVDFQPLHDISRIWKKTTKNTKIQIRFFVEFFSTNYLIK